MNESSKFGALPKGFSAVSMDELSQIEGGSIFSRIYHWVRDHITVSGKDMGGNSAGVVSVKGTWKGNP